jgi:GAF domain-containing protein
VSSINSVTPTASAPSTWFDMLLINDCEPDERLDDITRDIAQLFKVSTVMINLLTDDKIYFKSCIGETQGDSIDGEGAFCSLAVTQDEPLIISDTLADPRFKNYWMVSGPLAIRSYIGTVLHAPDGSVIGTLCLLDTSPRIYNKEEISLLVDFAALADTHLRAIL